MDMDTALRDPALVSTYSNPFPFSSGRAATMVGKPFTFHLSPITFHLSPLTVSPLQVALRPCSVNLSPFTSHRFPPFRSRCRPCSVNLSPLTFHRFAPAPSTKPQYETRYSHTSSVYAICPATRRSRPRGLCSDRQYFGGG